MGDRGRPWRAGFARTETIVAGSGPRIMSVMSPGAGESRQEQLDSLGARPAGLSSVLLIPQPKSFSPVACRDSSFSVCARATSQSLRCEATTHAQPLESPRFAEVGESSFHIKTSIGRVVSKGV